MKVLVKFFLKNKKCHQQITQHKRFVPYGTHPNFCFAKTSFMLETLSEIVNYGQLLENFLNIRAIHIYERRQRK